MSTYLHQWMFLGLIVVLGGMFAVDFVSSAMDAAVAQIVIDLEAVK
ncbi:MAG TPA: hypothetical protein VIG24_12915 [Acidimicrobiia bacterium]